MPDLLLTAAAVIHLHAARPRFEQEPITNFRRDLVAEDELRLRVEAEVADIIRRERIQLAWAARRIRYAASCNKAVAFDIEIPDWVSRLALDHSTRTANA